MFTMQTNGKVAFCVKFQKSLASVLKRIPSEGCINDLVNGEVTLENTRVSGN